MPAVAMGRVEQLEDFIRQSPNDPFPRYGLALEYKNVGRLEEAATAFSELMNTFPDYTAAYLHASNTLVGLSRKADAAEVFRRGIEACVRKRDLHAKSELEAALAELED
jgi:predicted Zn-dependent protease